MKVFCLFVVSRVSPLEGREAASSDETPPTHKEGEALEGAQGERGRAEVQRGLLVWQKIIYRKGKALGGEARPLRFKEARLACTSKKSCKSI